MSFPRTRSQHDGSQSGRAWGRKAGTLPSFDRYSHALKSSGIVWNDNTLDRWITDSQHMVPDNAMPFEGIKDSGARADLLAMPAGAQGHSPFRACAGFASDDPLANAGHDRLGSGLIPRPAVIVRTIYPIDKGDLDILRLLHFLALAAVLAVASVDLRLKCQPFEVPPGAS